MVDHFLSQVVATKKLRGQARGMVITRNIESAIRYYQAVQKELKAANAPFQAIVAFSGKKMVDGIEHTEESLNGFPSKDIPDKLAGNIKIGETNYRLACIMPFANPAWEKLHWFLKFLIPKLKVNDKDKDQLDALLESVDLSTYGLERVRLNQHIELDSAETELEPENRREPHAHSGTP